MTKRNTSPENPATPPVTPPATTNDKISPYAALHSKLRDFDIFKDNNKLGLFYDLIVHAPDYARVEFWDKDELHLTPRQGVFAGRIFAPRMKLSRTTVWRNLRVLIKQGFVKRTLQPSYSIYTLTGKGLVKFSKRDSNTPVNTPGPGPVTPPGTHSQESSLKSKEYKKTKVKVDPKHFKLHLTRHAYRFACDKLITDSLCNRLDLKLPVEMRTWLIAGVCEYFKGNCELASGECKSHLKVLATKLQGRTPTHKRPYVERTLNEYFYPDLFYKKKGG